MSLWQEKGIEKVYNGRLLFLVIAILLSFFVLAGRLACMQVVNHEYYEDIVERKRCRVEIHSGPRGTIWDSSGVVLAKDTQVFDAAFILPELDPLVVVRMLVCRVTGISGEEFNRRLESVISAGGEVEVFLEEITPRAARQLQHLAQRYPEKYIALIVRRAEVEGETVCSLDVDTRQILRKEETLRRATGLLGISYEDALSEVRSVEEGISKIANSYQRRYETYLPYPLAKGITREQVEELEVRYRRYPGIVVTERARRVHPHGDLACHVLGYLRGRTGEEYRLLRREGRTIRRGFNELEDFEKIDRNPVFIDDMVGATGLERAYQDRLRGQKGAQLLERDTREPESVVLREIPPKPGEGLRLTLDAGCQRAAQDALAEAGVSGAAVVLDVKTGGVLALASSPGFDLDAFRKDSRTFKKHLEEPYPLINRALSPLTPGSGFKLVTTIAALEEGLISPQTRHYCRGYYKTPGSFRCWKRSGHGSINLLRAIEGSCNVYFYAVGEGLGQEKLRKWAHILGFGERTGIDIPGEAAALIPSPDWKKSRVFSSRRKLRRLRSELDYVLEEIKDIERLSESEGQEDGAQPGHIESLRARVAELKKMIGQEEERLALFENERAWVPGDTRNMAIGQGNVLATPLQMARFVAAIANGGKLFRPHLVAEPGEDYVARRLPVSAETLRTVREGMRRVVFGAHGTARQDALRKHRVAAKTGTAELGPELNNGWLVGFAPWERPRVAFAVVAERVTLHGGEVAGPIAARILDAYFGADEASFGGN